MNATYQAFANAGLLSRAADVDIASLSFAARSELAGMAGIWNCTDSIELAEYFGVRTGKALALAALPVAMSSVHSRIATLARPRWLGFRRIDFASPPPWAWRMRDERLPPHGLGPAPAGHRAPAFYGNNPTRQIQQVGLWCTHAIDTRTTPGVRPDGRADEIRAAGGNQPAQRRPAGAPRPAAPRKSRVDRKKTTTAS